MRLAAGVVAVLVVPLVVIAFDPYPETVFYKAALFGIIGAGIATLVVAFLVEPKRGPDQPIDERRIDRYLSVAVLFSAFAIAAVALVFSTSQLQLGLFVCALAIVWTLAWLPTLTRRIAVQTQVLINRDPKTVFAFMLDGRNQLKYTPELISVDKLTEGNIGPGTQFLSKVRLANAGTFEGVEEIVEVDWGQRIIDRVANGRRPNRGIMTFVPVNASTEMTYRYESEVSYASALAGQGVLRWALTGEMRRRRMAIWMRLKQYLESHPDP